MEHTHMVFRLFSFSFQVIAEERIFDFFPIELRGTFPEIDIPEAFEAGTSPCSVPPRTKGQIEFGFGRLLFDGLISIPGAITVFTVKQATYDQHGRFQVIARLAGIAFLPESIEVGMFLDQIPKCFGCVLYQGISILESSQAEEISIHIILHDLFHHSFSGMATFQPRQEVGSLQEGESSVVMSVVAPEPVCYRTLRRNRFQCRMIG